MGKKQTRKKQAKESARWEAKQPPGMSRTIGFLCPRCKADLGDVANLPGHNATAHSGR
jgi:hypothetical protein